MQRVTIVHSTTPIAWMTRLQAHEVIEAWDRATALFWAAHVEWQRLMAEQTVTGEPLPQGVSEFNDFVEFVTRAFFPFVETPAQVGLPTPKLVGRAPCACGARWCGVASGVPVED